MAVTARQTERKLVAWKEQALALRAFLDEYALTHGTVPPSFTEILAAKIPGLSNTGKISEAYRNLPCLEEDE